MKKALIFFLAGVLTRKIRFFLVPPKKKSVIVYVGPWACRYAWDRRGRFSNGSHWSSGWHNWREEEKVLG